MTCRLPLKDCCVSTVLYHMEGNVLRCAETYAVIFEKQT